MSTASLAVGVSVAGVVVVIVVVLVTAFCVYTCKQKPSGTSTRVQQIQKGTLGIRRKADAKKTAGNRRRTGCCQCLWYSETHKIPAPDAPFGLELREPGAKEITIAWNEATTECAASTADHYVIYKRSSHKPGDWTKVTKVKRDVPVFRIKSLVPGRRYTFGVAAKNKGGESTIVETNSVLIKRDPVPPGAPTDLTASLDASNEKVVLRWNPPKRDGNVRVDTYHVQMTIAFKAGHGTWTDVDTLKAFDRYMEHRIPGLQPNKDYCFRVAAENTAGRGPYVQTRDAVTLPEAPEPAQKPMGPLKYSKITHSAVTLSWKSPKNNKSITGYAIEHMVSGVSTWKKMGVCSQKQTTFTATRLPEDVDVTFRVSAIHDEGKNSDPLVGGKVRTGILEIPPSQRSPSRLNSSRSSARTWNSKPGTAFISDAKTEFRDVETTTKLKAQTLSKLSTRVTGSSQKAAPNKYVLSTQDSGVTQDQTKTSPADVNENELASSTLSKRTAKSLALAKLQGLESRIQRASLGEGDENTDNRNNDCIENRHISENELSSPILNTAGNNRVAEEHEHNETDSTDVDTTQEASAMVTAVESSADNQDNLADSGSHQEADPVDKTPEYANPSNTAYRSGSSKPQK